LVGAGLLPGVAGLASQRSDIVSPHRSRDLFIGGSGLAAYKNRMFRLLAALPLLLILLGPGRADEQGACLSKEERRTAAADSQLINVASVIRTVKARGHRDVIRVRLCHSPKGLVYVLTLLGRDGKVTRATVDATSGLVVGAR
jgi:hypothetical protein